MIKNFQLALWTHAARLHCYSSWWLSWSGLRRPEAQGHGVALLLTEHLQGKAGWQWAGSILCSFWKREEKQTDLHNAQSTDSNRDGLLLRRNVCSVLTNIPWASRAERMKQLRRGLQTTEQPPHQVFSDCSKPSHWQIHKQILSAIWFVWPSNRASESDPVREEWFQKHQTQSASRLFLALKIDSLFLIFI